MSRILERMAVVYARYGMKFPLDREVVQNCGFHLDFGTFGLEFHVQHSSGLPGMRRDSKVFFIEP